MEMDMTEEMKELLHASIQWRHARAMCDNFKAETDSETSIPNTLLDMLRSANDRLWKASFKAEKMHWPAP
jgi:hypothetical protein